MSIYTINSPQVISEEAAGETVIINLETGSYYNLNEEASKLWKPLLVGANLVALKNMVTPHPACGEIESDSKLDAFFSQLIAEGLIKETTQSAPHGAITVDVRNLVLEIFTDMQDLLGLDPIHEVDTEAGWPIQQKQ